MIAQQARDAKKLKTSMAEEERVEAAKKAKFDSLVTLHGLTTSEFVEMRKRNMYALRATLVTVALSRKSKSLS
jgi:hypothetical protein